ncbi:hypothetical protein FACS189459_1210 [Bacilli bacterium]|nr:hypothetical protein FACS189459_1210 [Bacilli bacterium]
MELFTKEQVSVLKNEASEQTLIKVKLNKNHGNFEKGQIVYIREDPIEYVIDDAKSRIYSCGSYIGDVIKETPQKDEFPIHPYL